MRGSPLLRALLAFLLLLGLGFPLRWMLQADVTRPREEARAAVVAPGGSQRIHLQVSFTNPPAQMEILSLGQSIWQVERPGQTVERDLEIAYPKEGIDLQVNLAWAEGASAAARVRLTDPAGEEHVKLLWGEGATSDVLTFP